MARRKKGERKNVTAAVDDIAGKLIEAAYERFGRPPEPDGEYIATVTRESDVPAHFRELARALRRQELWGHWRSMHKLKAKPPT